MSYNFDNNRQPSYHGINYPDLYKTSVDDAPSAPSSSAYNYTQQELNELNRNSNTVSVGKSSNYQHVNITIPVRPQYLTSVHNNINATLKPFPYFCPDSDVTHLEQALRSPPSNDLLIEILCKRTIKQRQQIAVHYAETTGHPLILDIKQHTQFSFYKLISGLAMPYYEFLARTLRKCDSIDWLYYILFTISNDEIIYMKAYFENKYKTTVESFIYAIVTLNKHRNEDAYLKPLCKILEAGRIETKDLSPYEVSYDVDRLINMNPANKKLIKEIFYCKSFPHICAMALDYHDKTNTSIMVLLKKIYSERGGGIIQNIAGYALDSDDYFAFLLNISTKLCGGNDLMLTHIFVRRAEIDLKSIRAVYSNKYGDLRARVRRCSYGNYKYALYALLGETRTPK